MRFAFAQSVMIALIMTVAQAPVAQAADVDALRGAWELSAWHADGKPLSEDRLEGGKLVLDGDHFTVTLAGQGTSTGTQKLDAGKRPKTIDIMTADGPHEGTSCQGIYELDGDVFRVAFAPPGKPRPTAFTAAPDSEEWVHVWKRVKERE